ncbi:MAG TPA: hypothetical protein VFO60_08200, partial [Candidatus Dormibacteraeota bacterium]|nr:hypothetical protein [Candidatus Dormibacteraeota bacterium]
MADEGIPETSIASMRDLAAGSACRVRGTVTGFAGGAVGARLTLNDGTGEAVVWAARAAAGFASLSTTARVELDVAVGDVTDADA